MTNAITWAVILLILLAVVVVVLARLYERATRETSLVRTGVGGRKIVMDGGTLAIPYFHEVARVNMQTLRLEVSRSGEAALITKDLLRVDVDAEFHVSVVASEDGVARAAQTLGNRTFHPDRLRELIEGKLVDAMRAVAAHMTMEELHENRGAFVAEIRQSLAESLARNGLELDTVSLTALDQTPFAALDENNAFNAVGMRKLAEVIAKSKKERAEIDADAEVFVRQAAMQATKCKLRIELEQHEAEIAQVQAVETLKAAQLAEVVKKKAESERESARARIEMEQAIRAADIARERDLAIAEQERQITVAAKSHEESKARAAADAARAEAVKAAEALTTAKLVAEAERRREIALVAARQDGEIAAMRLRMSAQAEKDAAADRSHVRIEAAKAEASAADLRSAARKRELLAEAEGKHAVIAAENEMGERVVAMKMELAKLEALPRIVAEMVKPAEKIDSIRVHHVSGLGQGAGGGTKPPINQALDAIMDMAVQVPVLKKLGEEIGASLGSELTGVTNRALSESRRNPEGGPQGASGDKES